MRAATFISLFIICHIVCEANAGCSDHHDFNYFAITAILDKMVRTNDTLLHHIAGIFSNLNDPVKEVLVTYKLLIPRNEDNCTLDNCDRSQHAYSVESSDSCPPGYYCITTDTFIWAQRRVTAHNVILRHMDTCPFVIGKFARQKAITIYFDFKSPPSCNSSVLDERIMEREELPCGWICKSKIGPSNPNFPRVLRRSADIFYSDRINDESHIDKALMRITSKLRQYAIVKQGNLPGFNYELELYLGYATKYHSSRYFDQSFTYAEYGFFLAAYACMHVMLIIVICDCSSSIYDSIKKICSTSGDKDSASQVNESSGNKDSGASQVNESSGNKDSGASQVNESSGNKDSGASQVNESSGNKDSGASQVNESSGNKDKAKDKDKESQLVQRIFLYSFIFTSFIKFGTLTLASLAEGGGVCLTQMDIFLIATALVSGILNLPLFGCLFRNLSHDHNARSNDDDNTRNDDGNASRCAGKNCTCDSFLQIIVCFYIIFMLHILLLLSVLTAIYFIYNPSGTTVLMVYLCLSAVVLWVVNAIVMYLIKENWRILLDLHKNNKSPLARFAVFMRIVFAIILFSSFNLLNLSVMPFIGDYYYDRRASLQTVTSILVPIVVAGVGWYLSSNLAMRQNSKTDTADEDSNLIQQVSEILNQVKPILEKIAKKNKTNADTKKENGAHSSSTGITATGR